MKIIMVAPIKLVEHDENSFEITDGMGVTHYWDEGYYDGFSIEINERKQYED